MKRKHELRKRLEAARKIYLSALYTNQNYDVQTAYGAIVNELEWVLE